MIQKLSGVLQSWTPISVIVALGAAAAVFIIVWDTIHGIMIPSFVWGLLGALTGGTGAVSFFTHGVNVTNDTVNKTAIAQYPLTPEGIASHQQQPPVEHKEVM